MEKKHYETPRIEVITVEPTNVIAQSIQSLTAPGTGLGLGDGSFGGIFRANGTRNTWSNSWDD